MFSQGSIKESLSKFFKIDSLIESLTGYLEARVELLKLEVREDVSKIISQALVFSLIFCLSLMLILFISLGVALFLNRYFEENYLGFWIVAGFYLILVVVSIVFRKQLIQYAAGLYKNRTQKKA
jgi:uncharacterized membrane protein YqjE